VPSGALSLHPLDKGLKACLPHAIIIQVSSDSILGLPAIVADAFVIKLDIRQAGIYNALDADAVSACDLFSVSER
jgi:hypothetical protein